jgi:NAD(P)-dependent dehydrogenase (short-subunit alcohol dehydrogenase family)
VYPGGQALYASPKAALNHLTRHLAAEFGEFGVRANTVAPTSFPANIPTEQVVRSIVELDTGGMTGGVFSVGVPPENSTGGRHSRDGEDQRPS